MSLSNQWTFSVTRDDIIKESMFNVGALGEGETPTAQEISDCARKLNMLVKQWMGTQDFAPGLKMWERQRADLFLTSSQGIYKLGPTSLDNWAGKTTKVKPGYGPSVTTFLVVNQNAGDTSIFVNDVSMMSIGDNVGIFIGPDIYWTTINAISTGSNNIQIPGPGLPALAGAGSVVYGYTSKAQRPIGIVTCLLRDQFGNDTPLNSMTIQEYESISVKSQPQYVTDPSSFYYESHGVDTVNGGDLLFLDMAGAQDATKFLHIVYVRPVMDFVNPTDNAEYPQQWYRALCWGLTREICPMFDAEWTPEMQLNHDQSLAMAREADAETTAMYFQANAWNDYGV